MEAWQDHSSKQYSHLEISPESRGTGTCNTIVKVPTANGSKLVSQNTILNIPYGVSYHPSKKKYAGLVIGVPPSMLFLYSVQGGPGMLKLHRVGKFFYGIGGHPPPTLAFPKRICQTKKNKFLKKYENFLTKLQKHSFFRGYLSMLLFCMTLTAPVARCYLKIETFEMKL